MLPNHAPLVIAEQFGTLAALFPGRIDLGMGRAPGTDPRTALALRRNLGGDVDNFPQDVQELIAYLTTRNSRTAGARHSWQGQQSAGLDSGLKPLWRAARRGVGTALCLRLAFRARRSGLALPLYRREFRPSPYLSKPHVMLGLNVVVAETDAEARQLFTSLQQAFINLAHRQARPAAAAHGRL